MYKQVILNLGLCTGKVGPLNYFEIPKLELFQSIISCIQWSGSLPQWSVDITEWLHIIYIKEPWENTNGHNYPLQICCNLNCKEKCHLFDLATMLEITISLEKGLVDQANNPDCLFESDNDWDWKSKLPDIAKAFSPSHALPDLFSAAEAIKSNPDPPCFP